MRPVIRQPLVPVVSVFIFGIFAASFFSGEQWWWASFTLALVFLLAWAVSAFAIKHEKLRDVFFCMALALSGAALFHIQSVSFAPNAVHHLFSSEPLEITLTGVVSDIPSVRGGVDFDDDGETDSAGVDFLLDAEVASTPMRPATCVSGKVWVRAKRVRPERIRAGERVRLNGLLRAVPPPMNPGQFDFRSHLARRQINRVCDTVGEQIFVVGNDPAKGWLKIAHSFRRYMKQTLSLGIEDDTEICGVLAGMLYGDRSDFGDALNRLFRGTGTMHLFAVSGQNVGILAAMGLLLLRLFGCLRWRWGWMLIPFLAVYTLSTGAPSSAVRAFVMASFILVAWVMDRPAPALQLMAGAAWLILLFDPSQCFDIGFQLSFAVVLALILLTPPLFERLKKIAAPDPFLPRELWPEWYPGREAVRLFFCGGAAASVAAFAGSSPVTAWYFNMVTPVGLLVNVPVILFASAIVFVGALSLAAGGLVQYLGVLCNNANWLLASLLLKVISVFGHIPGGSLPVPNLFEKEWGHMPRVTFLSVESGQCAVVQSRGKIELMDAAGKSHARFVVVPFLKRIGAGFVDRLWLTQGNVHHVGGTSVILGEYEVGEIYKTGLPTKSLTLRRLDKSLPGRLRPVFAPFSTEDSGFRWEVLWPVPDNPGPLAEDRAVVVRLVAGDKAVLFAGDIGASVEKRILSGGRDISASVLVKGMHPQEDSLSEDFLKSVGAKDLVLNTGGYKQRLLSVEQISRLRRADVRLWDLQHCGAVTLTVENGVFRLKRFY